MKKLFHFDTSPEGYASDAVVVGCFDHRFELVTQKFLKRLQIASPDRIKVAGGVKALVNGDATGGREFLLQQVRDSARLHGTRRVLLLAHSDCGAYGGLAAFDGDEDREARHHADALHQAASIIGAAMPGLKVECYLLKFDGVFALAAPADGG